MSALRVPLQFSSVYDCCTPIGSDAGLTEAHAEDFCSFVVDNYVNQQYLNKLSDVAASGDRRFVCEVEVPSSPSFSPSPSATV